MATYTLTYERNWQIEPYVMEKYAITMEFDIPLGEDSDAHVLNSAAEIQTLVERAGQQARRIRADHQKPQEQQES